MEPPSTTQPSYTGCFPLKRPSAMAKSPRVTDRDTKPTRNLSPFAAITWGPKGAIRQLVHGCIATTDTHPKIRQPTPARPRWSCPRSQIRRQKRQSTYQQQGAFIVAPASLPTRLFEETSSGGTTVFKSLAKYAQPAQVAGVPQKVCRKLGVNEGQSRTDVQSLISLALLNLAGGKRSG